MNFNRKREKSDKREFLFFYEISEKYKKENNYEKYYL